MDKGNSRREFFKRHPDHAEDDIPLPESIYDNEINMNVENDKQLKLQRRGSFSNIGHKKATRSGKEIESGMQRKNSGQLVMQKRGSLPHIGRRGNSEERSKRRNHHYQESETSSGGESITELYLGKMNAGELRSKFTPQDERDDIPPLKLRDNSDYLEPSSFDRSSEYCSLRNAKALTNLKIRAQDVAARRNRSSVGLCPKFEEIRKISHRDCETTAKLQSINMKNMIFFPSQSLTRLTVEEIYAPKMRKTTFRRSISNLTPSRRGSFSREPPIDKQDNEKSSRTSLIEKDTLPGKDSEENMNVPKLIPTIIAKNISTAKFGRVRRQLPTVGPKPFVAAGCGKGIPELSSLPRPRIGRSPIRVAFPKIGDGAESAETAPEQQESDNEDRKRGEVIDLNDFHTFDEDLKPAFPCTTINIPAPDHLPHNGAPNVGIRNKRSVSEQRTKPNVNQNRIVRGKSVTNLVQSKQPQRAVNQPRANQPSNYNARCRNGNQGRTENLQTKSNAVRNPREMRKMQQDQSASEDEEENQPICDEMTEQAESDDDNCEEVTDERGPPSHSTENSALTNLLSPRTFISKVMIMLLDSRARRLENLESVSSTNENEKTADREVISDDPSTFPEHPTIEDYYNAVKGPSTDPTEKPTVKDAENILRLMIAQRRVKVISDPDYNDEESADEDIPEAQSEGNKQTKETRKNKKFKLAFAMPNYRTNAVPDPEETSETVEEKQPIKAAPKITKKPRPVWGDLPEVLKKRNDALRPKPATTESKVKLPAEKDLPKRFKTNPRYAHVQCKVPRLRAPTMNEMETELKQNYEEIEKLKKTIEIISSEENSNNREDSTEDLTNIEHDEEDDVVNVAQESTESPEIPVETSPVSEPITEIKAHGSPNGDDSDSDSSSIHTELSYDDDFDEEVSNSISCSWSESKIIDDNNIEETQFESTENEDQQDTEQSQSSRKSTKLIKTPSSQEYAVNREHRSKTPDSSDFSESKSERRPSSRKDTSKHQIMNNNIKAEHEPGVRSVEKTSSKNDMRRRDDSNSRDERSLASSQRTRSSVGDLMKDDRSLTKDKCKIMDSKSIRGDSIASSYKTAEEEPSTLSDEYCDALKTTSESTSESDVTLTPENVNQIKSRKDKKSGNKPNGNLESDPSPSSREPKGQTDNKMANNDCSVPIGVSHEGKLSNNYLSSYVDMFDDNLERTAVHIKYGSAIPCSCSRKAVEPCLKHVDINTLEFYGETVEIMGFYNAPEEDEREYCTAEDLIRQFCPNFYVQYVLENPHHPTETFYRKNTASRQNVIKSFKSVIDEENILLEYKELKINIGSRRNIHLNEDEGDFELAIEFLKEEYPGLYIQLIQANEFLQLALEKISVNDNRRALIKKSKMNVEQLAELNKKYGTI
ncbi:hypothetical protein WA026_010513 [Henosepilachna vigintioctopunctata]|uniref:Uncharacterized protein n=1 Tax=Henosepilachna vigintioctopunctata TaxID=420089 RepID=A0AAW1VBD8_9CUCU